MNNKEEKYKVGQIFQNNRGSECIIIERMANSNFKLKFLDGSNYEKIVQSTKFKNGNFSSPYEKSKCNIGYLGEYNKNHILFKKSIDVWHKMLNRCYDDKYTKKFPTYKNVTVCEEWHNFSIFQKWFNDNYIEGFYLDKDILQFGIDNKIYSQNTCVFLSPKLNSFIRVYDKNKNVTGHTGIYFVNKKFIARCTEFYSGRPFTIGRFKTKDEAIDEYRNFKNEQIDSAKIYMKNLGFYSDDIISKLEQLKELI